MRITFTLALLGIINLAIGIISPLVATSESYTTVQAILSTYERLGEGDPPAESAEESNLFSSIHTRSTDTWSIVGAFFACQGIVLLAIACLLGFVSKSSASQSNVATDGTSASDMA